MQVQANIHINSLDNNHSINHHTWHHKFLDLPRMCVSYSVYLKWQSLINLYENILDVYSPEQDFVDRCLLRFCGCCKRKTVVESSVVDEKKSIQSRSRTGTVVAGGTATTETSRKFIISVDPLDRDDIFYTGNPKYHETTNTFDADNITVLPGKEKEVFSFYNLISEITYFHIFIQAVAINYTMSVIKNNMPPEIKTTKEHNLCNINPKFLATLNLLFDVKLFKIIEFQCLLASASLFVLGTNIPFIYITGKCLFVIQNIEIFGSFLKILFRSCIN